MPYSNFEIRHIPALDGIRGLAILFVTLFHSKLVLGGYLGVDIFFVLSGFLITSLLLREWSTTDKIQMKRFYLRRALRLGPALLVVLTAACIYETVYKPYPGVENIFRRSFYVLAYCANWIWALQPEKNPLGSLDSTWSLSIEEQFYLLWPVLLLFLLKRRCKFTTIVALLFLVISASLAWRYLLWNAGVHAFRLYVGTDCHIDPILLGCLIGILAHGISVGTWRKIRPWSAAMSPFLIAGLLVILVLESFPSGFVFLPTAVALMTAILILNVTVMPGRVAVLVFETQLLTFLGKISYGLYLWHSVGNLYLEKHHLVDSRIGRIGIGLMLAIGSWYLVEQPILKMKKRFEISRSSSAFCQG